MTMMMSDDDDDARVDAVVDDGYDATMPVLL